MVLFWLHLASTIPSNAAPEAGLRARVGPATVNTRFNSGAITRMIGQARRVDVDFKLEGEHYIGEIKVTTYLTPQQAFRAAVGQVVEYAYLSFERIPHMIIFLDHSPEERRLAEKLDIAVIVERGRKFSLLCPTSACALSKLFGAKTRGPAI